MKKILLILAIISLVMSCGEKPQQAKEAPSYPVITLDTASATISTDYAAEIKSGTVVDIRPRVSGYIDKILVQEGSHVTMGQAIFQISQEDLIEQYNAAKANADAAKAKMDNAALEVHKLTPLVEKGIISQYELDNAKSNLEAAQASLKASISQAKNAEISLGYATITSPVSGVVGRIIVRQGTLVSPTTQDPLTTVSGDGDVSAYFSIDENTILDMAETLQGKNLGEKITKFPTVNLLLSNGIQYDHNGRLELASGLVDMTTGSYQVKGVFSNPKGELRSGSSGVVRISQTMHGIILVPQKATFELQDRKMAYVLDADNKVSSVALTIEGNSGESYVVSQGVKVGDRLVLEGIDFIKEGDVISPKSN